MQVDQAFRTRCRLPIVLVLLITAAVMGGAAQSSPAAGRQLDALVWTKSFPELVSRYPHLRPQLGPLEQPYFDGIIAGREGRLEQSRRHLRPLTGKLSAHRTATALRTLACDDFLLSHYREAATAYALLLDHYASHLQATEKQELNDNRSVAALLGGAPRESVGLIPRVNLPLRRDLVGLLDTQVAAGKQKRWFILDTGAGMTTIPESTARAFHLKMLPGQAETQGITGVEVPLHVAIIPQLRFGRVVLRNIPAQVVSDASLTIPGRLPHQTTLLAGILGFPELRLLGNLHFNVRTKQLRLGDPEPAGPRISLYMYDMVALLGMRYQARPVLFSLDTGAQAGLLTAHFLRRFPAIKDRLKPRPYIFAGAGGQRRMTAYYVRDIPIQYADTSVVLHDLPVLTEDIGLQPLDGVDGNMGQDLLRKLGNYSIDLQSMGLGAGIAHAK